MHRKEMTSICTSSNEIITNTKGYFYLREFSTFQKVTYIYLKNLDHFEMLFSSKYQLLHKLMYCIIED